MELLCSTGAFIGMPNGRNHRLLIDYGSRLHCDGFEFMMMNTWYDHITDILRDIKPCGYNFPVLHAEKTTGSMICSLPDDEFYKCEDLWKVNMEIGAELGCRKAVAHIWDRPDSDKDPALVLEHVVKLRNIAFSYGIDMLIENCVCAYGSPVEHFIDFARQVPDLGIIIDVRPAQFHLELGKLYASRALWRNNIRHLHVSDYHGGYMDFTRLRPILGPGEGDIDFPRFFGFLHEIGYNSTVTLESPAMQPDRVDYAKINTYLDYLHTGLS